MTSKITLCSTLFMAVMLRPDALMAQNFSPEMTKLLDARDDERCQKLGALPKTDAYINCRLKLQEIAKEQWAAQNLALQRILLNPQASQNQPVMLTTDPQAALKKKCRGLMGAALMAPTTSGNFGESTANASAAYSNCMAGLPPPQKPTPTRRMRCVKDPISLNDSVTCTEY